MTKYYTGIGSRETPKQILKYMENVASKLVGLGYILRSGGADGADSAFEKGCDKANGRKEIYIPWHRFNNRIEDIENGVIIPNLPKGAKLAATVHYAFDNLPLSFKKLHSRNPFQLLGQNLKVKSEFVICWTRNRKEVGGTATNIKLAIQYKVPVYNLAISSDKLKFEKEVLK